MQGVPRVAQLLSEGETLRQEVRKLGRDVLERETVIKDLMGELASERNNLQLSESYRREEKMIFQDDLRMVLIRYGVDPMEASKTAENIARGGNSGVIGNATPSARPTGGASSTPATPGVGVSGGHTESALVSHLRQHKDELHMMIAGLRESVETKQVVIKEGASKIKELTDLLEAERTARNDIETALRKLHADVELMNDARPQLEKLQREVEVAQHRAGGASAHY